MTDNQKATSAWECPYWACREDGVCHGITYGGCKEMSDNQTPPSQSTIIVHLDQPNDDAYQALVNAHVEHLIKAVEALGGDPFDLITACEMLVLLVTQHLHNTTDLDGVLLLHALGDKLHESADQIATALEDDEADDE